MNSDTTEQKTVWIGVADGLVEVRAAITKIATVPESMVRDAVEQLRLHRTEILAVPEMPDAFGVRTDRAARRARRFGRVLR